ncbi:serine/threonine protein kinase [Rhodococcus sp. Eu-32]|nr:serine/threonine protein kinase [Rhodococcus sp. Eu-32]
MPRFPPAEVALALGVPEVNFLGEGAFGDTWQVGDRAIKIICDEAYPPERVAREVSGLRRVDSPHVVRLFEAGSVELGGRKRPALTFEFVPGGDLEQTIAAKRRPSSVESHSLLLGLLMGVQALHAANSTLHRDIKPGNVALRNRAWSEPVLLDLGLAKSTSETTFTRYPGRLGTDFFMPPEQLTGQRARKASDLFAIGVTVRLAITGRHPFFDGVESLTIDNAIARIEAGPSPLPPSTDPRVLSVLDRLVSPSQSERGSARSNLRRLD